MTIKTKNSIGDLLELPFHIFKKQYDEMVKYYQELHKLQEEEQRKSQAKQNSHSWSRKK